jgi:exodeoxyribonuclease VII large subunit
VTDLQTTFDAAPGAGTTIPALSISDAVNRLKQLLRGFEPCWLEGEIEEVSVPSSGHLYLTIADDTNRLRCVMWRGVRAKRDCRVPCKGELVRVHATQADLYGPRGSLQLFLDDIAATGEGELLRRRQETLDRLAADGLTSSGRKRRLPRFPRRIALVTSDGSDAARDVVAAVHGRWPLVDIVVIPSMVQGVAAPGRLIAAINAAQQIPAVDVIVVARGGGSVQDLSCFDDEALCRMVASCRAPVLSSIGHTAQRPNIDHVADACAHVPAATAQLLVPDQHDVTDAIASARSRASELAARRVTGMRERANALLSRVRPAEGLARRRDAVASLVARAHSRAVTHARASAAALAALRGGASAATRRAPTPAHARELRVRGVRAGEKLLAARRIESEAVITRGAQTRRSALARVEDFRRARARMERQARALARRETADYIKALERRRVQATAAGRRAVQLAAERASGLVRVASAHDPTRRGLALLAGADGHPVRRASDLAPGERFTARLLDGTVRAAAEHIELPAAPSAADDSTSQQTERT